jgi:glycosyltransferase involved in cell wall biosynthesis
MRIAQLHWAALPTTGGVETHVEALVEGLRAAGDEVTFLSGTPDARTATYHPALRPPAAGSAGDDPAGDLTSHPADELADLVSDHDLLHVHNPQWHRPEVIDGLLVRLGARGWPGGYVFTIHNLAGDGPHQDRLRRWSRLAGGRLVAHSRFVAEALSDLVDGTRADVLPLALPPDTGGRQTWASGNRFVVLQPTRLTTWKGSHLSLGVAADLLDAGRDLVFVHAGTRHLLWQPGLDAGLLARIQPWRERGAIRFEQFPPERSWAAIRGADIVVHPTTGTGPRGEPYSMSVAQAMLCRRPVVVSGSGNLPDLVRGYPLARLVEPGDPEALRAAVDGALAGTWPAAGDEPWDVLARLREWHDAAVPRHRALYHEVVETAGSAGGRRVG